MFKILNGVAVNKNAIKKIIPMGIDPKDEKEHCKVVLISDVDECGIDVAMSLKELLDVLNK
jgi:hypothetical protein